MSKSRMISFRVTEEEYGRLLHLSARRGIANLSELARAGIERLFDTAPETTDNAAGKSTTLEERITAVERKVSLLFLKVRDWQSKKTRQVGPAGHPVRNLKDQKTAR